MENPERRSPHQVPWLFGAFGLAGLLLATLLAASLSALQVTLLAGTLLLLGLGARLWAALALKGLIYRRQTVPRRAFCGETLVLETSLGNRKLLPLPWIEVWERLPLALDPGGPLQRSLVSARHAWMSQGASLRPYQRARWQHQLHCRHRGVYTLDRARVSSGDPFGLVERDGWLDHQLEVMVYPAVVPLRRLSLSVGHPAVDLASRRSLVTDPTRTAALREYQPGDPQRLIHWRATAHAGELQVRVPEQTTNLEVTLFLDARSFQNPWELYRDTLFELTLSALASIAVYLTQAGCPVGLFANADPPAELLPGANLSQLEAILESLARVEPRASSAPWPAAHSGLPRGSTVVFACSDAVRDLETTVARLQRAGHQVLLLMAGSGGLPPASLAGHTIRLLPGQDLAATLEGRL